MEQLLLHLIGDYITQTNWMANNKTKNPLAAALHAIIYTVPFCIVFHLDTLQMAVILVTHFFIDHYRLARYVVFVKNWITEPTLQWEDCKTTGYPASVPPWLSVWLLIIADNTLHLCINYGAIRWL